MRVMTKGRCLGARSRVSQAVKAIKRTVVNASSLRREGSTMLENVVVTRASHKSCCHGRDVRCGYARPVVALVLGEVVVDL